MEFKKDIKNKKIFVKREFKASPEEVWNAWTKPELLDQWWAPKPWKAKTKSMDFREGGKWLYSMQGPNGEEHFSRADYKKIIPYKSFTGLDSFADADGNMNNELPVAEWTCTFEKIPGGTVVNVEMTFKSEADLNKLVEMGFKEGFEAALTNLDDIFEKQKSYS
ncbi:MAG TPA: SRPBCC domain-containing protein [Ignavibacteriaceae bacterium]|nr:SRPBCC domain-containing protein [Ignavibacteriaceae bacterium]